MSNDLLLAIDQGTTGSTALVMEPSGRTLSRATREFSQNFPKPGWVEHEPAEIWASVEVSVRDALEKVGIDAKRIAAIGITNQRETTLLWDRKTGEAVHRAIVWQDRRTAARCAELKAEGREARVREVTGLLLDPYFSGTKLAWMLDEAGLRARAEAGELCFGTVDSYIVHRLTRGAGPSGGGVHVTDVTNASRTLLMSLESASWSDEMLELFRIPSAVLPIIVGSAEEVGKTRGLGFLPDGIPITGIAGDQQAALFGQGAFAVGDAKCTYGTGAFALANIGKRPIISRKGMVTTVASKVKGEITYALEGSAFIAGAAVQWLRDGLGIIQSAADVEELARRVPSSDGVTFVPALSGLGAPHWDPDARGLLCGITRGTTAAHVARAVLEGIAFEVGDLLDAMAADLGRPIARLRVDGGAAANDLLMQFQAVVTGATIERPTELESTARGAAMLAGIGVGLFSSPSDAAKMTQIERTFTPAASVEEQRALRGRWADAVARTTLHPS